MKKISRIAALIGIAALAATMTPAAAAPRTVTESYVGSYDPFSFDGCDLNNDLGVNYGVVCIKLKAADDKVDIEVRDVVNPATGFFYMFTKADGSCARVSDPSDPTSACETADFGCPITTNIAVPNFASHLKIWPSGAVLGPVVCTVIMNNPSPGTATAGEVIAKFK